MGRGWYTFTVTGARLCVSESTVRSSAKLVGWKQIAGHLGVSPRTAQLWERTRGLPVHRLPGSRGGIFALSAELDAWDEGRAAEVRSARTCNLRRRRAERTTLRAAGVLMVAALAAGGWFWLARSKEIMALRFDGAAVVASDKHGGELWRVVLPPPQPGTELDPARSSLTPADLDGDGRKEAVGVACYKQPNLAGSGDTLTCGVVRISPAGGLLWNKDIEPVLHDASGNPFAPGWELHSLAVAPGRGRDRIWLALSHRLRYPGVVVELLADGAFRGVFANYGHVNSLAAVRNGGKTWLVAGGASSALLGGFLALIDPDKGLSIAPEGGPPRYRFLTPAQARPEVFFHIPRVDLTEACMDDVNAVSAIELNGPSSGWARVQVGNEGCRVFLEFGFPLQLRAMRVSSACELGHRKFEKQGVISHPFERCPYLHEPMPLRKWTVTEGWTELRVPTANMQNVL